MVYLGREVRRAIAKRMGTLSPKIGKKGSFGRSILNVDEDSKPGRVIVLHATKGRRNYSVNRIDHLLPRIA